MQAVEQLRCRLSIGNVSFAMHKRNENSQIGVTQSTVGNWNCVIAMGIWCLVCSNIGGMRCRRMRPLSFEWRMCLLSGVAPTDGPHDVSFCESVSGKQKTAAAPRTLPRESWRR